MGTGWVGGGVYPVPSHAAKLRSHDSGAGPVSPCRGLEWVVMGPCAHRGTAAVQNPPFGPGRHPAGTSLVLALFAASQPIVARFHYISCKVSQNSEVSPEKHEKACHSPCLQNGLKKSPLEILEFLFLAAFSHKELMGHFGRVS